MTSVPTSPYIDAYLAEIRTRCEPTTVQTYKDILYRAHRLLLKAGSPLGLPSACAEELRDVIHVPGRSKSRRHGYRVVIGGFFTHACDQAVWGDDALDYDPTQNLATVKVPRRKSRAIPTDQLGDILARSAQPYRTWYLLAAAEALRCVEISRLDREHVAAPPGDMWVRGKGSKERLVPTHAAVWAAVNAMPPGPVARTPGSRCRATPRQVMDRGNYHLHHHLGHADVTMHMLRHWGLTHMHRAAGGDVLVTQAIAGHASPDTTQIYVDVADQAKRAAVDALPLPI